MLIKSLSIQREGGAGNMRKDLRLSIILSLGYACFLALLPIDVFLDRENYLNYVENAGDLLEYWFDSGILKSLANEPIWLFLNHTLNFLFKNAEIAVRFYIFLSAGIFSFFVLRKDRENIVWLLIFLIFPQIIKNYIVHLRQGVAIAVFLVGWNLVNVKGRWFVMVLTPFIHASLFFVIILMLTKEIISRIKLSPSLVVIIFFVIGLGFSQSINYFGEVVGARQVNEYEGLDEVSGLGFVFWLYILGIFLLQGTRYFKKFSIEILFLIFYLTSYYFIPVAARIFESTLILILLAGLSLSGWRYRLFLFSICFYMIIFYAIQWDQPWFGFGV